MWKFPSGSSWKFGFGNHYERSYPYAEKYREMLSRQVEGELPKPSGAFLPYGGCMRRPAHGERVLFVGDAAGYADPISGEGLYFAFLSARFAADSITDDHYRKGMARMSVADNYTYKCLYIADQIKYANRLKTWFFKRPVQKAVLALAGKHPDTVARFLDEQVSEYREDYRHILRFFTRKKS